MKLNRRIVSWLLLGLIVFASACESETSSTVNVETSAPTPGKLGFVVDPEFKISLETLEDRPLTAIKDDEGVELAFIANEIAFWGDDGLEDFLKRTNGEVVNSTDLSILDESLKLYLVRVKLDGEDYSDLTDLWEEHNLGHAGQFTAFNEDALRLLAMASRERIKYNNQVSINPYLPAHDASKALKYIDGGLQAAPTGNKYLSMSDHYSRDPADWHTHGAKRTIKDGTNTYESVQDINVVGAWNALALAGRVDPANPKDRVSILIVDGGFLDADLTEGSVSKDFGRSNSMGCGENNPCPWHGTTVAQVAVGDPHSGLGTIGTGGPVANARMVSSPGDLMSSMIVFGNDYLQGLEKSSTPYKIINMSFGSRLHWSVDALFNVSDRIGYFFIVLEIEAGILSFAAAGNDGEHLHKETCFLGVCWEKYRMIPCHVAGVTCVGGMDTNTKSRDPSSNYGYIAELWAPYTLYAGFHRDADISVHNLQDANAVSGTSYSSPYMAGVAALVIAANPKLKPHQVRDILLSTAHQGEGDVHRYVNAYKAVVTALGGEPFESGPLSPAPGTTYKRGMVVQASVPYQAGDFPASFKWTLDGQPLSDKQYVHLDVETTRAMSIGEHTLAVTITAGPYSLTRTTTFNIANNPPEFYVSAPRQGEEFYEGNMLFLKAEAWDKNADNKRIPESKIVWTEKSSGHTFGTGSYLQIPAANVGIGNWTIVARATDGIDEAVEERKIKINKNPDVLPPSANITSPRDGQPFIGIADLTDGHFMKANVLLEGKGMQGISALEPGALEWSTYVDLANSGQFETFILGYGPSINATLYVDDGRCTWGTTHEIRLKVTNKDGISTTQTARIWIRGNVC